MKANRRPSKTFQKVEGEARAVDEAMGRLDSATAIFERSRTQVAMEVGAVLAAAQAKLSKYGEGVFNRWLSDRLKLGKSTAYKWLRLHEYFGDCPQCIQTVDVSALYILAQNSSRAYRDALKDTLALAEKGERVSDSARSRKVKSVYEETLSLSKRHTAKFSSRKFSTYYGALAKESLQWRKDAEEELAKFMEGQE